MMIAMIIAMMKGTHVSAWMASIPGKPPTPIAFARTSIKLANMPANPEPTIAATKG